MAYPAVITDASIAAATNAKQNAITVDVTEIAIGTGDHGLSGPSGIETGLINEIARFDIRDRVDTGPTQVTVAGYLSDGDLETPVTEVGVFLADGTLFAIAARTSPAPLLYKSTAVTDLMVSIALELNGLPIESINVSVAPGDLTMLVDEWGLEQSTLNMRMLAVILQNL